MSFSSHQLPSKHSKGIVLIWFIQYFTLTKPFKCFLNDLFVNLMPVSERCCSEAIGKLLCWGEFKQCHYLRSFNFVAFRKDIDIFRSWLLWCIVNNRKLLYSCLLFSKMIYFLLFCIVKILSILYITNIVIWVPIGCWNKSIFVYMNWGITNFIIVCEWHRHSHDTGLDMFEQYIHLPISKCLK